MSTPPQDANAATRLAFTRATALPVNQLDWASTVTAPTECIPYTYTEAEVLRITGRRHISVASVVCGLVGLALGVIGVFGLPVSLLAVTLAVVARSAEHRARSLWMSGLAAGLVGLVLAVGWVVFIGQIVIPLF